MTNYEKIKQLLEMNVYDGVIVLSLVCGVPLSDVILNMNGLDLDWSDSNLDDITSIMPIPRVPKLLPVGTKVRVFGEDGELIEDIFNIVNLPHGMYGYILDDGEFVPARAVYPVF